MNLENFLSNKPLFYTKFDPNRIVNIYQKIASVFSYKHLIHIVGTNGKGTTGRYIANALYKMGYKVGHYSSPHIISFNERIWCNGANCDNNRLDTAHHKLFNILDKDDLDSLSYFEYTTLLAMIVFIDYDWIVLEAGLGGEFDATNVFNKDALVVTPIGFDHQAFLGDNIKDIVSTKLRAKQDNKPVFLALQPFSETINIAKDIVENNYLYCANDNLESLEIDSLQKIAKDEQKPNYIFENMLFAYEILKTLNLKPKIEYFKANSLIGRMQKLQDNLYIDVGHNPLAASVIKNHFKDKKIYLIYNSFEDKDIDSILDILYPIIKNILIFPITNDRVISKDSLERKLQQHNISYQTFEKLDNDKTYLVFGSFSLIEEFLNWYKNINS